MRVNKLLFVSLLAIAFSSTLASAAILDNISFVARAESGSSPYDSEVGANVTPMSMPFTAGGGVQSSGYWGPATLFGHTADLPFDALPNGTNDYTYAQWVCPGAVVSRTYISTLNSTGSIDDRLLIAWSSGSGGKVFARISDGTNNLTLTQSDTIAATGCRHIAVVMDRTGAVGPANTSYLYVNGLQKANGSISGFGAIVNSSYTFRLGASSGIGGASALPSSDELMAWQRPLNATEINATLYRGGYSTGGYYPFVYPPVASSVQILQPYYDSFNLIGTYTYTSPQSTAENGSALRWYRNGVLATPCFQEQANVSTACGGLATGSYGSDATTNIYVNYTVPTGYLPSQAQVKLGLLATQNVTIPQACVNNAQSTGVYRARMRSTGNGGPGTNFTAAYDCYNGTAFTLVVQDTGADAGNGITSGSGTPSLAYDGDYGTNACSPIPPGSWRTNCDIGPASVGQRSRLYEEAIIWGVNTNTFPASLTTVGDNITFQVTPSDGSLNGTAVNSSIITVIATPTLQTPVATNTSITPSAPLDADNLTAQFNITNATSGYNYTAHTYAWYRVGNATVLSTSSTLSSSITNGGDVFVVQVTPAIVCVQGDFNTSSACGSVASGATDYVALTSFTFSNGNDAASPQYVGIFNYTKPAGATNASTIFARTGANTTGGTPTGLVSANYSISSSCWNAYSDKLRFGFRIARSSPISPFYSEFVELFCNNNTGGWERFYYAGHGTVAGCDNPNGITSTIAVATDNNLNSYVCVSSSYGLNYQPTAPYFGNPACGRTGSCSAVSAGTVAGFQMNWVSQGSAVNSTNVTVNGVPTASNVTVNKIGNPPTGYLQGTYSYTDLENAENGSTYKWYRNNTVIGTSLTINLTSLNDSDIVKFEVTPRDGFQFGSAVNSSNYTYIAHIAPTIETVNVRNSTGSVVTNFSVTTPYYLYANNFTHMNISDPNATLSINFFVGNSTFTILNETFNVTALTTKNSSSFQLPTYQAYFYNVTITDEIPTSTSYSGNLLAGNQQPVITAVQTYRGGLPNNCQADTTCEIRVTLTEDGCTLSRQSESVVLIDPDTNTLLNDTSLALTLNSGGSCQYKSDSFIPITAGDYPYYVSFTDYGGLNANTSGNFSIAPATQPPPSESSTETPATVSSPAQAGAGAGGGVIIETVILKQEINQSYQLVPDVQQITVRLASDYDGEFQVVNDGLLPIFVDIDVNAAETSTEIKDWLTFDGITAIRGLQINPGQGFNSNSRFIRYNIDSKRIIPVGKYKLVLDVKAGGMTKKLTIDVTVRTSVWAQFDEFWNKEVADFGEKCISSSTANLETNVSADADTEQTCTPKTIIRVKHIAGLLILGSIGAMIAIGARTRRVRRERNI